MGQAGKYRLLTAEKGPGSSAQSARSDAGSSEWSVAEIPDFVPQGFDGGQVVSDLPFLPLSAPAVCPITPLTSC